MRRHVQHLDLVGVVGEELAQAPPVVAVGLLLEADHPGGHRQDAVLAHQADRLAIGRKVGAFLDQAQRLLVGVLETEQEAVPAGAFVKMQDVGVAHDVAGPGRAHEYQRHVLGDQCL